MSDSLQARILSRVERDPHGHALGIVTSHGEIVWRSRSELADEALRTATALSDAGLHPGDVCLLVLEPDALSHIVLLGCLLAGGVPVLVAPPILKGPHSNLTEVLRSVAGRTGAKLLVSDVQVDLGPGDNPVQIAASRLRDLRTFGTDPGGARPGEVMAAAPYVPGLQDIAALQLTSGTTGFPRICIWRQDRVLAALDGMSTAMCLGPEDGCVNWTPLYHDMGLVNNALLCFTTGMPLAVIPTMEFLRNPAIWLQALHAARATMTWSPNFGFAYACERISDEDVHGVRLDHMRAYWNAAERVHVATLRAFHDRFAKLGVKWSHLKTNFGCAENVGGATFSDPDGPVLYERLDSTAFYHGGVACSAPEEAEAIAIVGVGRPYPGMQLRIVDDKGHEVEEGRIGRILLKTPSAMNGYLLDEEGTADALKDGWLFTGDLGYVRGEELFWTGRSREVINLRGRKIDPSDLEEVLFAIDGVRKGCFAAFGIDDEERGTERLVIITEVETPEHHEVERIARDIRERVLSHIGAPVDEVILRPRGTMTKTSSGKRRHRFYRELYLRGEVSAAV